MGSAETALALTLTARQGGTENDAPMGGIPHHALEGYLARLLRLAQPAIARGDFSFKALVQRPGLLLRTSFNVAAITEIFTRFVCRARIAPIRFGLGIVPYAF